MAKTPKKRSDSHFKNYVISVIKRSWTRYSETYIEFKKEKMWKKDRLTKSGEKHKVPLNFWTCEECGSDINDKDLNIDHIEPVVPLDRDQKDMGLDEFFERQNCSKDNLQILCLSCHKIKTKTESAIRAKNKKERKLKESKK